MKKLSTLLLAIFLTFSATDAKALIDVPTFRFGLGESPLSFSVGTAFPAGTALSAKLLLNPMFLWDVPNLRARIGVHFLADIGSKYGAVSTAGIGVTALFYPLGLSSSREVRDDDSEVIKTRMSPYLQFSITPTKFSATDSSDQTKPASSWPYVSARVVEISLGIGADYPLANDLIVFGGLHYRTAAFSSTESNVATGGGDISYNGIALIIGFMTNFY